MCIIALKFFDGIGWVGVKNRDRNYKPLISIKKTIINKNLKSIYILDNKTDYSEGINTNSISILSSATAIVRDELEGIRRRKKSKDGIKIRKALTKPTIEQACNSLIEDKLSGHTIVFNKNEAILLEAGKNNKQFEYHKSYINKDETIIRTNHGIFLPWLGYQPSTDPAKNLSRKSSVIRLEKIKGAINNVKNPMDLLDCLSMTGDENPQFNPLRLDMITNKLATTSQILIIPSEIKIYYKPIWSVYKDVDYDYFEHVESDIKFFRENSSLNLKEK